MKKVAFIVLIFSLILSLSSATPAKERLAAYALHQKMAAESIFSALTWREIGPYFCSGRLVDIEAYVNQSATFLVAAASGGLWKTDNMGTTWTPLFDHESSISIGDLAISQSDPGLIWVGTGEANSSRSTYAGTGVFKSTDGGKSWQHMGLEETHHIARILVDPRNTDIVYVAALGHLYTDNEERGLYKSSDGGKSWEKVLYVSPRTGIVDVVMHPADSRILYAASWEKERKAWNMVESGPESAVWKSTDAGKSWEKVMNGLPQGKQVGRIGLATTPAAPDHVYAFLDNQEARAGASAGQAGNANAALFRASVKGAEVYRSTDGGQAWTRTHDGPLSSSIVNTYGYYFGQIAVSPADANVIYLLGVPLMKSTDGGKSFKSIPRGRDREDVHADHHALWIDPGNPKRLLLGNDGGLNISYDEGKTFQKVANLPLAQCYTVNYDFATPYNVYTGLQDNGVNMGPSTFAFGDTDASWRLLTGGDGAFVCPHPDDPNLVYAASQFGSLSRLNLQKRRWNKNLTPRSEDAKAPYRLNWLTPFMVSQHNPMVLYLGANRLLKLTAPQDRWQPISPDLSDGKNTDGDVPFATITAIDESPLSPDILYAGTDDGNVWTSRDGGKSWEACTSGLPKKWVTRIVASKYKKERVYLTMTGYREDDFTLYAFASEDLGKTWKSLKANLPDEPVNVIREDPVNENLLYLGTDLALYATLDRGGSWHSLKCDLPTNAVYDLRVHPRENELIIGTHGRGVFIMPISRLQQLTPDALAKPIFIFKPKAATRPPAIPPQYAEYAEFLPKSGAEVSYFLKEAGAVAVEIAAADGKAVRTIKVQGRRGLNLLAWDLKAAEADQAAVAKGDYRLTFRMGKASAQTTLEVREADTSAFRGFEAEPGK